MAQSPGNQAVQALRDKDSEVFLVVTLCLLNPGFVHDVPSAWDIVPSLASPGLLCLKPTHPVIPGLEEISRAFLCHSGLASNPVVIHLSSPCIVRIYLISALQHIEGKDSVVHRQTLDI